MNQPRISKLSIWENHEKRVIEVLLLALSLLQKRTTLVLHKANEEGLNTELYFCLIEANRILHRQHFAKGFDYPPTAEGRTPQILKTSQTPLEKERYPIFIGAILIIKNLILVVALEISLSNAKGLENRFEKIRF